MRAPDRSHHTLAATRRSNVFLDHCTRAPGFTVWSLA